MCILTSTELIVSFIKGHDELCGNRGGRNEINNFGGVQDFWGIRRT
jgi:hypothetical protein